MDDLHFFDRTMIVGEFYHSMDINHRVVKVLWHPLAYGGSHLAVLMNDGTLR